MKRLLISFGGLLLGCAVGWLLPALIYPWDTVQISSVGPQNTSRLFQFFGVCLGGPIGFFTASWLALRWVQEAPVVQAKPRTEHDPHRVEDNLG
jgi:hypothetical protein